jgi:hypothetical protein
MGVSEMVVEDPLSNQVFVSHNLKRFMLILTPPDLIE